MYNVSVLGVLHFSCQVVRRLSLLDLLYNIFFPSLSCVFIYQYRGRGLVISPFFLSLSFPLTYSLFEFVFNFPRQKLYIFIQVVIIYLFFYNIYIYMFCLSAYTIIHKCVIMCYDLQSNHRGRTPTPRRRTLIDRPILSPFRYC